MKPETYMCKLCGLYFTEDYAESQPNPNGTGVVCPGCYERNLKDYDDEDENGIQGI